MDGGRTQVEDFCQCDHSDSNVDLRRQRFADSRTGGVKLRDKSRLATNKLSNPDVTFTVTPQPNQRKLAVRCYSTDTALDYAQGAYTHEELQKVMVEGSREAVHCRRSASLQQHPTIGAGAYRKLEAQGDISGVVPRPAARLVRGGVGDPADGALMARRRPPAPVQRQMIKRTNQVNVANNKPNLHSISIPSPSPYSVPSPYYASTPVPMQPSPTGDSPPSPAIPRAQPDGDDTQSVPTWNTYLYQLQLQAPKPVCISPVQEVPNRPPQYDPTEFHGNISRQDADRLLSGGDGCYLVRKSERGPDTYSLAIRFDNETKNFKLYYDGQHFVGEKRFESVHDLVADGLIHFFIELRAADYIKTLSQESNYEESPYMAYTNNLKRKRMGKTAKGDPANGVKVDSNQSEYDVTGPGTNFSDYEKPHIFKVQNFGAHFCDYCRNFMWGLRAQGVKCQDCGFQAHKRCSEKVPNDCMPDMKYVKRIFGGDLTAVVKAQKSLIPLVVEKCVKEIELRGMDQEGLYRLAGFHDHVEALRMAFDKDSESADVSSNKYEDINTVCSTLKLYFRLLPIPLITCEVYKRLMEIIKNEDLSAGEQVQQMKEPINNLPPAHFHTLKYMCQHLRRVVDLKSKNMMSSENLAIVFAPTLMRSDDKDPMASLMAAKFEQKLMELVLVNCNKLLGK